MLRGGMTSRHLRRFLSFFKLQLIDRFEFLIVTGVEISFRSPNMGMTQKALNRPEIDASVQEGGSECVPHSVGRYPLPNEGFLAGPFDQTVDRPGSERNHPMRTMLSQGVENGVIGVRFILSRLPVLLDGSESFNR